MSPEEVLVFNEHDSSPIHTYPVSLSSAYSTEAVAPNGTIAFVQSPDDVILVDPKSGVSTVLEPDGDPAGVAFDADSNLYVGLAPEHAPSVVEYPYGASGYGSPATVLKPAYSGALSIDTTRNLVVQNLGYKDFGYSVYPHGATTPAYTIGAGLADAYFSLDRQGRFLYALNDGIEQESPGIWIFRYPTGTPYAFLPFGVANQDSIAVEPANLPGPPWSGGDRRSRHR